MRDILKTIIRDLELEKLGFDEMGFYFYKTNELSFHHTIIQKKDCKNKEIIKEEYLNRVRRRIK